MPQSYKVGQRVEHKGIPYVIKSIDPDGSLNLEPAAPLMTSGTVNQQIAQAKADKEAALRENPPGFLTRLGQSVGIPTSLQEAEAMQPSIAEAAGGPLVTAGKMGLNYIKGATAGAKQGFQEVKEAAGNIASGQPVLPNLGKAAYGITHAQMQATPIIGPPIETAGEDIVKGNYSGAAGGLTGAIATVAAPELIKRGGEAINARRISAGAEKVFKAASPPGSEGGFRDNLETAKADLAQIQRETPSTMRLVGKPERRVREFVANTDKYLHKMYQTERLPQIQRIGTQTIDMSQAPQAITDAAATLPQQILNPAGVRQGGKIAGNIPPTMTVAEVDELARAVNKQLRGFESMTASEKAAAQAEPRIAAMKALDKFLSETLNAKLRANGLPGIESYEKRYAALSNIRDRFNVLKNPAELENLMGRVHEYVTTRGTSGISTNPFNVMTRRTGGKLRVGLKQLGKSNLTNPQTVIPPPPPGAPPVMQAPVAPRAPLMTLPQQRSAVGPYPPQLSALVQGLQSQGLTPTEIQQVISDQTRKASTRSSVVSSVPAQPMNPVEVADLSKKAGRPLTEESAQAFRKRDLTQQSIAASKPSEKPVVSAKGAEMSVEEILTAMAKTEPPKGFWSANEIQKKFKVPFSKAKEAFAKSQEGKK